MALSIFWWSNILYLISYSIKIIMYKPLGKLKAKWVLIDSSILLSQVDPEIKAEERAPLLPVIKSFQW